MVLLEYNDCGRSVISASCSAISLYVLLAGCMASVPHRLVRTRSSSNDWSSKRSPKPNQKVGTYNTASFDSLQMGVVSELIQKIQSAKLQR